MLPRVAKSLTCLAAVVLMLAAASLAAPVAEAQRKKTTAAAYAVTLRVIVPDMVDEAGVLRTLVDDFQRRFRTAVRFVPADLKVALKLAEENKADVLLTADHEAAMRVARAREKTGYEDVMYADLLIVGPAGDPAKIAGMTSMITAFESIAKAEAAFISRGDGSATNLVEQRAWAEAGIEPKPSDNPWYTLTGADMRTTLGLAAAKVGLHAHRPGDLAAVSHPQAADRHGRPRPAADAALRRAGGDPGVRQRSAEEGGAGLRRLAHVKGGPAEDRRLPRRQRNALLAPLRAATLGGALCLAAAGISH